jgi:S-adenosylmethionine hydrolase
VTRRRGLKGVRRRTTSPTLLSLRVPITLLTDFGATDYFVGAVKGVILSINPSACIVDLTHDIPAQDIPAAAFTLLAAYKTFPKGTVHVAVVDPGVGSARRGLLVNAGKQFFVGPDNGIFSYIYEREQPFTVFELTNTKYFRNPVSQTFHGRDIFAPVAAALSQKSNPALFGKEITDPVRLEPLAPKSGKAGMTGRILHIDRFGNCITNLSSKELTPEMIATKASLLVKGKTISSFRTFFAEAPPHNAEIFCIWGSADFLEIAVANGSAAESLKVSVGDEIRVKLGS